MAHLIDKDALVAEIERRIQEIEVAEKSSSDDQSSLLFNAKILALHGILSFIDSLPASEEDPSSKINFEQELYNYFGQVKDFTLGMRIAKRFYDMGRKHQEPVSKELEEAAMSYGKSIVQQACDELSREYGGEYTPGEDNILLVAKYFKYGAQWQKRKDFQDMLMSDNRNFEKCYEQGKEDMKQQMMKEAIERTVKIDAGGYPYIDCDGIELYDYDKDVPLAKEGDKYKVILIKED